MVKSGVQQDFTHSQPTNTERRAFERFKQKWPTCSDYLGWRLIEEPVTGG